MLHPIFTAIEKLFNLGYGSDRQQLHRIDSRLMGRPMDFSTFSPPGELRKDAGLVCLFHGLGNDHRALDKYGLSDSLYAAMEQGRIPPMHVVTPNGERGFYVNWRDGSRPYEDHIIEEVLPEAEALLGLDLSRDNRHLLGVSMGGLGAVQTGLRHPDLFSTIIALSAPVLNERQAVEHVRNSSFARWLVDFHRIFGDLEDDEFMHAHNPYAILKRRPAAEVNQRIFLSTGDREREFFLETSKAFHRFLDERGIDHHWEEYPGKHGWKYWSPVIEKALVWAAG